MEKFRCIVSVVAGPEYKAPLPGGEHTFVPASDILETIDLGTDGESAIAVGGYRIYLPGGHNYWISKNEFEEAYHRTDMSFGQSAEGFPVTTKLINAEKLLQAMKKADEADPDLSTCWSRGSIRRIIEGLPTVDAVEVVRCKDCKRGDYSRCGIGGVLYCLKHSRFMVDDAFCSYGERRRSDA